MSTRSRIVMKMKKGYRSIYCHWNGYPSWNGRVLVEAYQNKEKIEQLLELGDLSILDVNIGKKHDFEERVRSKTAKGRAEAWCLAYGRDRGESGVNQVHHESFKALAGFLAESDADYVYLWKENRWFFAEVAYGKGISARDLKPLTVFDVLDINLSGTPFAKSDIPVIAADYLEEHNRQEDADKIREFFKKMGVGHDAIASVS